MKYVLKRKIKLELVILQFCLLFVLVCEFESIGLELLVKIPLMMAFLLNHWIIETQTDFYEKGF